jgi:hypothetical protein
MCPVCDKFCPFMRLSDSCVYAKVIPDVPCFRCLGFNIHHPVEKGATMFPLLSLVFGSGVNVVGWTYLPDSVF